MADEEEASLSNVKSELLPRCFYLDFNTDSSFVEVIACQIPHTSQLLTVPGVQPLRMLIKNKPSVPSALSPINRAFVLSLEILMPHTTIGRQVRAQFPMVSQ